MKNDDWIRLNVFQVYGSTINPQKKIDLDIRIDHASNIPRDTNLLYSFYTFIGELRKHGFSCEVVEVGERK